MNTNQPINKNQDKATKPQTVQIVRQGEATPYWFLLIHYTKRRNGWAACSACTNLSVSLR
ncbi:hypothetical protein FGF65_06330 [Neisseria meningitidis]|nr:hypothetical protein [Neisseria meningitidis]